MQWSADRNAGFSRCNPQKLFLPVIIDPEYHYEAVNVETQQGNSESLLWWTKRMIAMRKQHPVFGRGSIEFLDPENTKVLCFLRVLGDEEVLVVANLSRHAQYVELDLSKHRDKLLTEMSGGTQFPAITESPYMLSVSGYGFVWFSLQAREPARASIPPASLVTVEGASLDALLTGRMPKALESALLGHIREQRWFRGKARKVKSMRVVERIPLGNGEDRLELMFVQLDYDSELSERYVLPLGTSLDTTDAGGTPDHCIARLRLREAKTTSSTARSAATHWLLYDATTSPALGARLIALLARKRTVQGRAGGTLQSEPERALRNRIASGRPLEARVPSLEQSNTTLFYGDELVLKLFRQIDAGENPDAELTRFLTARNFPHVAPVLGVIDYDGPQLAGATLGLVQRYVPSHGNAWDLTLEALGRALEHALSLHHAGQRPTLPSGDWLAAGRETPSESVSSVIGSYVEVARALGRRVAELHTVLASEREDEAFAPEPFAGHYHRSVLEPISARYRRAAHGPGSGRQRLRHGRS
jgi:maltose alpha-D-glucosyltransferase/alpha-amylase